MPCVNKINYKRTSRHGILRKLVGVVIGKRSRGNKKRNMRTPYILRNKPILVFFGISSLRYDDKKSEI